MTTYYVRKTGNNGNAGTSAGAAWLTIDHAANNVAAGDTVYIGGGWYGESVTIDTDGSSGSPIVWRGDVLGVETGDPGLVVISSFDSPTGANVRNTHVLDLNHKTFNEFYDIVFYGGSTTANIHTVASIVATTSYAAEGVVFERCFIGQAGASRAAMAISVYRGVTPTANGLAMRRCTIYGNAEGLSIAHDRDAAGMTNLKWSIENCMFLADTGIAGSATGTGTTNSYGGVTVTNCTFITTVAGATLTRLTNTTDPFRFRNCHFLNGPSASISPTSVTAGAVTQGGNAGTSTESVSDEYSSELGSARITGLLGGLADMSYYHFLGWSPFRPFEPLRQPDGTQLTSLVDRLADNEPANDWYGRARPLGRSQAPDVGHVEANPVATTTTSDPPSGETYAVQLPGAMDVPSFHEVAASATQFDIWIKRDANYAGSEPDVTAYDEEGNVLDTAALSGGTADNTWEEVSLSFTPAAAGVVRIVRRSQDTSASGVASFGQVRAA